MAKATTVNRHVTPSQILGVRLPLATAREIKSEAARRGVKLNKLVLEMWDEYRQRRRDAKP